MPPPRTRQQVGPIAALAVDLDRTLLRVGWAPSRIAIRALREAQAMGLRTLLVSGRTYPQLSSLAREFGHLDGIVAENGAVVEVPLGSQPRTFGARTASFARVRCRRVPDLDLELGEVVIAVPLEEEAKLRRCLKGLRVEIVRNIDRAMALPTGVSKLSGTQVALRRLRVEPGRLAAIGDAENDVALLRGAGLSGAVSNAQRAVKAVAAYRCEEAFERGVLEFVQGPVRVWARLPGGAIVLSAAGPGATGAPRPRAC